MTNAISNVKDVGAAIAKMSAQMFADKCNFIKSIDKEDSLPGTVDGFQKGDVIKINKPARFVTGTNPDITSAIQDVKEETVSLTLGTQRTTAIALTSAEIATDLALKSWAKRVLEPAVSGMSQETEADVLTGAKDSIFNLVGSPGSTVFDTDTMLSAGEKLANYSCPMDDSRIALLAPGAMRSAVNARKGLFQDQAEVAKQYRTGAMGKSDGFTYLQNNLLPTHTNGGDVTGLAVEASVLSPATGATQLGIDGVGSGLTIKKGTVFTISGVNAVHPITKADLGVAQQFVVTADVTESASNQVTLSISPTIYSSASGSLQNVSALPVDEAAITVVSGVESTGYRQSLVYHPSFYRIAFAPLVKPDGTDMIGQETVDGITVRVIRDYAILTDKMIMRLDVLYGHAAVRPEWACRVTS